MPPEGRDQVSWFAAASPAPAQGRGCDRVPRIRVGDEHWNGWFGLACGQEGLQTLAGPEDVSPCQHTDMCRAGNLTPREDAQEIQDTLLHTADFRTFLSNEVKLKTFFWCLKGSLRRLSVDL